MNRKTLIALVISLFAAAQLKSDPVNHDRGGIAIRGYDPVASFAESKPMKGNPAFSYTWRGATWRFASEEHRTRFARDPEKYAPRYGGYCAYGVSEGHAVDIDPEAWRIIGGRLYLNYSQSVQRQFLQDAEGSIRKAEQNWPGLHK